MRARCAGVTTTVCVASWRIAAWRARSRRAACQRRPAARVGIEARGGQPRRLRARGTTAAPLRPRSHRAAAPVPWHRAPARRRRDVVGRARGARQQGALHLAADGLGLDAAQLGAAAAQHHRAQLGGERGLLRRQRQRPALARAVGGDAVMLLQQRAVAGEQGAEAGLQAAQFRRARQRERARRLAGTRDAAPRRRGSWWSRRTARAPRAPACPGSGRWYSPSIRSGVFSNAEPRSSTNAVRIGAGRASRASTQPASTRVGAASGGAAQSGPAPSRQAVSATQVVFSARHRHARSRRS